MLYRDAIGENSNSRTALSSIGGDYSLTNPWDAPGKVCPILYRRAVGVHPYGTVKKRPIKAGFGILARSEIPNDPNGTLLYGGNV